MQNTVQIILPTYNNLYELKLCLSGIEKQSYTEFELMICVDGSTDGTDQFLEKYHPGFPVKVLHHADGQNHGRNPARNLAFQNLTAKYVVLLDSDLIPDEGFLEQHLKLLNQKRCISVGTVKYTNANTNLWAKYQMTRGKNQYSDRMEIPSRYFGIQNAGMETAILKKIGGFDTQMLHYGGNDNELSLRIRQNFDIPFIYNQTALATGEMNKDLNLALMQMYDFGQHNLRYMLEKYPDKRDYFRLDYILGDRILHRLFWSRTLVFLVCQLWKLSPEWLRLKWIHFLTAYFIRSGYHEVKISNPSFTGAQNDQ